MKKGNELISVIIPVYQVEKYLERCINSVINQTYDNLEIILIDDGSKDKSGKICDEYSKIDSRILVVHTENQGVSSARNTGIDNATGDYVLFCDADDFVQSDWCDRLYRSFKSMTNVLPVCNYYRICGNILKTNKKDICDAYDEIITSKDFFLLNKGELLGIPWNKLYSRNIIENNKIRFNESLSLGEDLIFVLDYIMCSRCDFKIINIPLYNYSIGNNEGLSEKYYSDLNAIYKILYKKLSETFRMFKCDKNNYKREYYQSYFYAFNRVFRNTWSKENKANIISKIMYNSKVFHSDEFKKCCKVINKSNINIVQYWGLCSNSYVIYCISIKFSEFISRIKKRG